MDDQANEAIDPMDQAASLIANSLDESEPPEDDEEQDAAPEDAREESEDAEPEEEGATEAPKEVTFAGQKFDLPANTPPEVVEKVAEIGKQLQGDYTRKTQELASREKQAAEIVQNNSTKAGSTSTKPSSKRRQSFRLSAGSWTLRNSRNLQRQTRQLGFKPTHGSSN